MSMLHLKYCPCVLAIEYKHGVEEMVEGSIPQAMNTHNILINWVSGWPATASIKYSVHG